MAYPQTTFASATIDEDSLLGGRRQAVVTNTLLYQLDVLRTTGRYDAFKLGRHEIYDRPPTIWPVPDHLFWDSDVAKWIEGACYFLRQRSLPQVEAAVEELVNMIASAQQPDGYLNIHYTVVEPGKRFTNLRDMHELYNAGHLIEAALAHENLYHNQKLLGPILKYVDLLVRTFGPEKDQIHGYPGHPEIELALLRLYHHTNDPQHLALAQFFILERGNRNGVKGQNYFSWEAKARGADPDKRPAYYPEPECLWYHQAHLPIVDQETVEGHAVRAMYLLTAVADLCRIQADKPPPGLQSALFRLWHNMIDRKMYITGGVGAVKQWEGFGKDYYLPQSADEGGCYSETCAAIAVMMLAQRLLQIDLSAEYADIMELCLYNAVLTSMSYDGKRFTYENHLASSDEAPSVREEWFTVACCPPNVLRLLGSLGGYVWTTQQRVGHNAVTVCANLYISSTLDVEVGDLLFKISQKSEWPWKGDIEFQIEGDLSKVELDLKLRLPEWATDYRIEPACDKVSNMQGYLHLPSSWIANNRSFRLIIPLSPRWLAPHPATGQRTATLARGPIIYCVEDIDNSWVTDHFKSIHIDKYSIPIEVRTEDSTGERYVALVLSDSARKMGEVDMNGSPFVDANALKSTIQQGQLIPRLNFIPYYHRSNRAGKGHMRVGLQSRV